MFWIGVGSYWYRMILIFDNWLSYLMLNLYYHNIYSHLFTANNGNTKHAIHYSYVSSLVWTFHKFKVLGQWVLIKNCISRQKYTDKPSSSQTKPFQVKMLLKRGRCNLSSLGSFLLFYNPAFHIFFRPLTKILSLRTSISESIKCVGCFTFTLLVPNFWHTII